MGTITGHTGLLALIGSPVGHSGSPATWNFSFDRLGMWPLTSKKNRCPTR